MTKLLKLLLLVGAGSFCAPVSAADFTVYEGSVSHSVHSLAVAPLLGGGKPALIVRGTGTEGSRYFSVFTLAANGQPTATADFTLLMPKDSLFFDYAALDGSGTESLLFFDDVGVLRYNPETGGTERLIHATSIYRHSITPLFEQVDFSRDLTGDGFADILVPDFKGYRLFVNDGKGGFTSEVRLNMQVEMRLASTAERYDDFPAYTATPRYTQFPVFSADANFDGLPDILFLQDHAFIVFHQKANGTFSGAPARYSIEVPMTGNSFAEQWKSRERYSDQSNLAETSLQTFEDINGDGIPDMVTETDKAEGMFNRTTSFAFYYGYELNGKLAYRGRADADIQLKGFAAGTRFVDIGGDGRKDFASGAVDIGLGKIISILLSGSASIHVHFFEQKPDGTFAEKADYRKKVSVDVNLSSGQSTVPVVELADIDGDGHKDLVISDDQEELRFYTATPNGKDMFNKKDFEKQIVLPRDSKMVRIVDLNGDGKAEILIHYDRLGADGQDNVTKFKVLAVQ